MPCAKACPQTEHTPSQIMFPPNNMISQLRKMTSCGFILEKAAEENKQH